MAGSYDIAGLVVIVAGGSTGLGLSAARQLVAGGARVLLFGLTQAGVDAALVELGDEVIGFAGDATDPLTSQRAVEQAVARWGRVDALYHVAGGSGRRQGDGPLHELSDEGWRYTLDLNLTSVMLSNRAVIQQFLRQGSGGCIVNVGSVLGWSPAPEHFASHAYAAAKAALIGFCKATASYYARDNIRINVLAPGLVETPMSERACGNEQIMRFVAAKQPLDGGRVASPSDLDGAALFLLSRASGFITGQVLAVDGGWTVS